jgi:hypothetical protein
VVAVDVGLVPLPLGAPASSELPFGEVSLLLHAESATIVEATKTSTPTEATRAAPKRIEPRVIGTPHLRGYAPPPAPVDG